MKFTVLFLIVITAFSFTLVHFIMPTVNRAARYLKMFNTLDKREILPAEISPVGGIPIFISFMLTVLITSYGYNINVLKAMNATILIFFFVGLRDDIIDISTMNKFFLQSMAILILILGGGYRITGFHGLFGIQEINNEVSLLISFLFIMGTVNAWNMIDGIDGQAAGLGILASVFFGTWFFRTGDAPNTIMSFALAGSLAGFFVFNVFGKKNKVFMGDSGSLVTGSILAGLAIQFIEAKNPSSTISGFQAPVTIAFAVLFVPLFDMTRVCMIRLRNRRSPFFSDHNHIHHLLLKLIPRHIRVAGLLILLNVLVIVLTVYLDWLELNIHLVFGVQLLCGVLPSTLILWLIKKKVLRRKMGSKIPLPNNQD